MNRVSPFFMFFKVSYIEHINLQKTLFKWINSSFNQSIYRKWLWKKTFKSSTKKKLHKQQNSHVTNKKIPKIPKKSNFHEHPIFSTRIRRAFSKNIKSSFRSHSNSKLLILCWNETNLLSNSCQGMYQLKCTCKPFYFTETNKSILTWRSI